MLDSSILMDQSWACGSWDAMYLQVKILLFWAYSWIGRGLQSGPTLAFSLWLSDFKTRTSFGFLVKKQCHRAHGYCDIATAHMLSQEVL